MTKAMYERLAKVQNDWTVILQTEDDGIQAYHFNTRERAFNFADNFQDEDLLGVMPRPVYILHLEDAFLQDDIEA